MTLVWIGLTLVGLAVGFYALLWGKAIRSTLRLHRQLDEAVAPALEAVEQNAATAGDLLADLADRPEMRNHLYARLEEIGKADLFPDEYRSLEKIAQSDLAHWLLHPNELGAVPAEIELVRELAVEDGPARGSVLLFRFRAAPSHWAADRGWMAGVAGPYWEGDEAFISGGGTFSELMPFDQLTEEQHVEFLRQQLGRNGLVMPS